MLLLAFLLIKMSFAAKKLDEIVAKLFMLGIIYYKNAVNGKNIRWRSLWK